MSRSHRSSSRHRHRRRPSRPRSSRRRHSEKGCDPLVLCGCTFGTPFIQSILLFAVPLSICVIYFLAGFWKIPVWKYESGRNVYKIAAQGFSVSGQTADFTKFLYDAPWPAPVSGFPALLLIHFILSLLLLIWLLILLGLGVNAVQNRSSSTLRRDAWAKSARKPRWFTRAVTILFTLATATVVGIDLAVWIIAREQKKMKLNPDTMGYFVNLVVLFLWILWVVLQCAATQDRRTYYIEGGRKVYEV